MVGTTDGLQCVGDINVGLYDTQTLLADYPDWDTWSDTAKLAVLADRPPEVGSSSHNVTCVGLHQWIADSLHAGTPDPADPVDVALGRSNVEPSSTDTELNDEVARVDITEFSNETTQIRITSFVGEHEANVDVDAGETLSEVGIYTADNHLLNHAVLPTHYEKDETKTMSVEIVLSFTHS